jgi:hypothetical protein
MRIEERLNELERLDVLTDAETKERAVLRRAVVREMKSEEYVPYGCNGKITRRYTSLGVNWEHITQVVEARDGRNK